jgi:branched-chain amino acid transport system ATP-binding protein
MDHSNIILKVDRLYKTFGGVVALCDVSFDVKRNEITAIIGPNGAGKTTALNLMTGIYPPTSGKIILEERAISGLKPFQIASQGITRTFQNLQIFQNMTVLENVMVGLHTQTKSEFTSCLLHLPRVKKEERLVREEAFTLLRFFNLVDRADWLSDGLSYGDQKRLEIARALAGKPKMILLDEPAAGLNIKETEEMAELFLKIKEGGTTILLVEHDMNLVMGISDRIVVLNYGERIFEGTPRQVQMDSNVIQAYLGRE